ncbi:MAG: polysaccharide deacetylase family protein, partial [Sphingosinicella sp.]
MLAPASQRPAAGPAVAAKPPQLLVVVDTEEEFDWNEPFSRAATATSAIAAQARAHEIFDRFGIVPTYVVDYPVAANAKPAAILRKLKDEGRAEIGAHLHPWVTPPFVEEVNARNSYGCNLPPEVERAKIETLTAAIGEAFGERPTIFKAGRHGLGPSTVRALVELGYRIDCSALPHSDLRADG